MPYVYSVIRNNVTGTGCSAAAFRNAWGFDAPPRPERAPELAQGPKVSSFRQGLETQAFRKV
jgi:hypothetical protein